MNSSRSTTTTTSSSSTSSARFRAAALLVLLILMAALSIGVNRNMIFHVTILADYGGTSKHNDWQAEKETGMLLQQPEVKEEEGSIEKASLVLPEAPPDVYNTTKPSNHLHHEEQPPQEDPIMMVAPPATSSTIVIAIGQDQVTIAQSQYSYRYPSARFQAIRSSYNDHGNNNNNNTYTTSDSSRYLPMVAIVMSSASKQHRRDMIRSTWASSSSKEDYLYHYDNQGKVLGNYSSNSSNKNRQKAVFFVVAGEWTSALEAEFTEFQDLIWVDVPEEYVQLTYKVYAAFHAVHHHIPAVSSSTASSTTRRSQQNSSIIQMHRRRKRYILKTDDDVYVKFDEMEASLLELSSSTQNNSNAPALTGYCWEGGEVLRENHPLAVSREIYAPDKYPMYCSGPAYAVAEHAFMECAALELARQESGILTAEDAQSGILAERCGLSVQGCSNFLEVGLVGWNNNSLALHFSYFIERSKGELIMEQELASVMFRHHTFNVNSTTDNDQPLCRKCYERVALHLGRAVDCGQGRLAPRCDLCPEGQGVGGCGGDCRYYCQQDEGSRDEKGQDQNTCGDSMKNAGGGMFDVRDLRCIVREEKEIE